MKYARPSFSHATTLTEQGRENWDRIFKRCTCDDFADDPCPVHPCTCPLTPCPACGDPKRAEQYGFGSSQHCDDPNGGPCGCGAQHRAPVEELPQLCPCCDLRTFGLEGCSNCGFGSEPPYSCRACEDTGEIISAFRGTLPCSACAPWLCGECCAVNPRSRQSCASCGAVFS